MEFLTDSSRLKLQAHRIAVLGQCLPDDSSQRKAVYLSFLTANLGLVPIIMSQLEDDRPDLFPPLDY